MQHKRRDDAAGYAGDEMLVFQMAQHANAVRRRAGGGLYQRHFPRDRLQLVLLVLLIFDVRY